MQLTVTDPAVDHVDLVLEAWSAAPSALRVVQDEAVLEPGSGVAAAAQLSLRLEDRQIPLWDQRG